MLDIFHRIQMHLNPRRGIVATISDEELVQVWTANGRSLLPPPQVSQSRETGGSTSESINEQWYSDYETTPRLFFADCKEIEFISGQLKLPRIPMGEPAFVEGDWDKDCLPIEEGLDFIPSFRQYLSGAQWEDTPYYQRELGVISRSVALRRGARHRCSQDLIDYLGQIEKVYLDIRENGYQVLPNQNQIYVNIDRDGRLLFQDGRHRFAFVRILGIDRIPVAIRFVHSRWRTLH